MSALPYVLDPAVQDWPESYRVEVVEWARSQGMVPELVASIVVHPGAEPFAEVLVYDVNEDGTKFLIPGTEEYSKHVETVPLLSPPPLPESTR